MLWADHNIWKCKKWTVENWHETRVFRGKMTSTVVTIVRFKAKFFTQQEWNWLLWDFPVQLWDSLPLERLFQLPRSSVRKRSNVRRLKRCSCTGQVAKKNAHASAKLIRGFIAEKCANSNEMYRVWGLRWHWKLTVNFETFFDFKCAVWPIRFY